MTNLISPTNNSNSTQMHTHLGNPTWLGFKLIYVWVSSLKLKGQIGRLLITRWVMIPILGLNGPLWIGGKSLIYSKPIIGNGIDC